MKVEKLYLTEAQPSGNNKRETDYRDLYTKSYKYLGKKDANIYAELKSKLDNNEYTSYESNEVKRKID